MITIKHLRKEYATSTPLMDVNLHIEKGEIISLIGASGTGKSTLLRCINMLETPTSGTISYYDEEITGKDVKLHEIRKKIGMVFQNFHLFNHMNVLENVMYAPMKVNGVSKEEATALAMEMLETVSMAGKAGAYPDELSGGQKQRVAIARTLAMKPEMILFDEPTSSLDPTMAGQVLSVIKKLASQGMTMMIVTHEMEFARTISTRILYMDQGEIYEDGTPKQIFDHPLRNRTRQFIQQMRVLHRRIEWSDFDYLEFSAEIENFGRRHMMDTKKCYHAMAILEELCVGYMSTNVTDVKHLHYLFECQEHDNRASVTLLWKGSPDNPVDSLDEVSRAIVLSCAEKIEFESDIQNNSLRFINI